jgi:hypothetical protein
MKNSKFRYLLVLMMLLGLLVAACGEDEDDNGDDDENGNAAESDDSLGQEISFYEDAFSMQIPEGWVIDDSAVGFGRIIAADEQETLDAPDPQNGTLLQLTFTSAAEDLDIERQLQTDLGSLGVTDEPTIETAELPNGYTTVIYSGDIPIGEDSNDIPGYIATMEIDGVLLTYLMLSLDGDPSELARDILDSISIDSAGVSAAILE